MALSKIILASAVPAKSVYTGKSNVIESGTSHDVVPVEETYTWPIIDYATCPGYNWQAELSDPTDCLCFRYDDGKINVSDDLYYMYVRKAGGPLATMCNIYNPNGDWHTCYFRSPKAGSTTGAGAVSNLRISSSTYLAPITISTPMGTYCNRLRLSGRLGEALTIYEAGLWRDMSPSYNPQLTTYSLNPILPESGQQTFTAMSGRKNIQVFSKIQYRVSASFTWSDPVVTSKVQAGLKATLQQGSPILFAEPWEESDTANRPVHMVMLDSIPPITQPDRGTWQMTIEGVTQP